MLEKKKASTDLTGLTGPSESPKGALTLPMPAGGGGGGLHGDGHHKHETKEAAQVREQAAHDVAALTSGGIHAAKDLGFGA